MAQTPPYAILRIEKHKTPGTLGGALQHALRERETPNADPARKADNLRSGVTSSAAGIARMRELYDALELKPRHKSGKNAPVVAVEFFIGMSPDAAIAGDRKRALAYMQDALRWLTKRHGARNVIGAQVHFDETTPHMSVFVFPEVGGQLNAKSFFGGRAKLSTLQTEFARDVGSKHGLVRGVEGSKAKHVDMATYYAALRERDQLQDQVAGLRGDVQKLTARVAELTTLVESFEPAVRAAVEEKAARTLADRQATSRPPSGSERAIARSTGPQAPSKVTSGRRSP